MMVRFTPAAVTDVDDIYRFIARTDPLTAQRVEDRIRRDCERLGRFPGLGASLDIEGVRRLPLVRYPFTIFYRVVAIEDAEDILRVVHGASVKDLGELPDA